MPKKNKESKAFKAAILIRKDLMSDLEKCKTPGRYKEIMGKYRQDQLDGHFSLKGIIVASQKKVIQMKDAQIEMQIKETREKFEDKLVQLNQKELVQDQSESSIEESEYSDELAIVPESPSHILTSDLINSDLNKEPEVVLISETPILTPETPILTPKSPIVDSETSSIVPESPAITKQIHPERVIHLARVKTQLDALSDKKAEFIGKYSAHSEKHPTDLKKLEEFNKAIQATENIHASISILYTAYIYGDIELDYFKQTAAPLLSNEDEDVKTLKSHRGFKEIADIVANLLILIGSAGVVHAAAALYTGKFEFGLFKSATKSGAMVEKLNDEIENSHVAAASA